MEKQVDNLLEDTSNLESSVTEAPQTDDFFAQLDSDVNGGILEEENIDTSVTSAAGNNTPQYSKGEDQETQSQDDVETLRKSYSDSSK